MYIYSGIAAVVAVVAGIIIAAREKRPMAWSTASWTKHAESPTFC